MYTTYFWQDDICMGFKHCTTRTEAESAQSQWVKQEGKGSMAEVREGR